MTRKYTVVFERGRHNWSAYVPDLPGCIATGRTRRVVERRLREAIEFHLEGMKLHGEPIPEPTIEARSVVVSAGSKTIGK